jgi:hypothetical protein
VWSGLRGDSHERLPSFTDKSHTEVFAIFAASRETALGVPLYHNLRVSSRGAKIFARRKYSDVRRSVTPGRGHPGDSSTGGYVFGCGHAALGNLWLGMGSGLLDGLEWHG